MASLKTLRDATVPLIVEIPIGEFDPETGEPFSETINVVYRPHAMTAQVEIAANNVLQKAASPHLAGAQVSIVVAQAVIASWDLKMQADDAEPIPLTADDLEPIPTDILDLILAAIRRDREKQSASRKVAA